MFQFPGFAISLLRSNASRHPGFPIRTSTDQCSFAAPRSFSQLTTSFVASKSQGIPHTPLFASYSLTIFARISILFALTRFIFTTPPLISLSINTPLSTPIFKPTSGNAASSLSACQRTFLPVISQWLFVRERKYMNICRIINPTSRKKILSKPNIFCDRLFFNALSGKKN